MCLAFAFAFLSAGDKTDTFPSAWRAANIVSSSGTVELSPRIRTSCGVHLAERKRPCRRRFPFLSLVNAQRALPSHLAFGCVCLFGPFQSYLMLVFSFLGLRRCQCFLGCLVAPLVSPGWVSVRHKGSSPRLANGALVVASSPQSGGR